MLYRRQIRATTPAEVMDATLGAVTIGLVPVMGAIHEGHLSLIRRSHAENDDTIVALVDPSGGQIAIPDTAQQDVSEAGASILYLPAQETIFPADAATSVHVSGLADRWEGDARPGHFDRMTTLFTVLLNQLQPTRTYIGEKHLQLLAVIERAHEDLSLSGEIVPCPIVRDPDGLPLSSYNAGLTAGQREAALAVPSALFAIQQQVLEGEHDAAMLEARGRDTIAAQPAVHLDYLAIVDPVTFEPQSVVETGLYAIAAATVGDIRIIDNVYLQRGDTSPEP
ncbi:MAG TPA: pantoate--beta-alanine ligase [Thermomicrobiales bacterium]|nr:pantoate--beta-alanine ligase [Thermomicrobiales bacterium]